jgi:anti-sigma factor ChrR (cupin superfamily)
MWVGVFLVCVGRGARLNLGRRLDRISGVGACVKPIQYELPDAWREALGDENRADLELAAKLPELLESEAAAPPGGLKRLLESVAEPPLRYAPFFDRVGALWDLPEAEVSDTFAKLKNPSAWQWTALPGVRVVPVVGGPRTSGAETFLVRFAPGTRFPHHRHPGPESLLVLEGSYTDSAGTRVAPGDLHAMAPGTEHGFLVGKSEPCIGAVVQYGREFTGLFMRALASVFDRK